MFPFVTFGDHYLLGPLFGLDLLFRASCCHFVEGAAPCGLFRASCCHSIEISSYLDFVWDKSIVLGLPHVLTLNLGPGSIC